MKLPTNVWVTALVAGAWANVAASVGTAPSVAQPLVANGSMSVARAGHEATVLTTGEVLITGGCAGSGCEDFQSSCELYMPGTGSFQAAGPMATPRVNHVAVLLRDGRVLSLIHI